MDYLYIVVFVLLTLGVVDLVVGVSNDAVNFLISAIGCRVAKRKYIYMIAGAGLLIGCLFSGNMMEVARNGIFDPGVFYLDQLLYVFLAVMITDILLIDAFNTFGYPTSTTVAIVFELLGGALALGLIVIGGNNPDHLQINDVINIKSAFIILLGIVLSVIIAFFFGLVTQFISRLVFTFNYNGKYKIYFSIAGAVAITAICFFVLKKDFAITNVLHEEILKFISTNLMLFLSGVFLIALILFLFISFVFNVDITKIVVYSGTFTIALSFASNDLVNFIGVPLTGLEGIKTFKDLGLQNTSVFLMNIWDTGLLNYNWGKNIYNIIYIVAGVVMVITLFTSRKLRSVTETEMHLGRQHEGLETFEASPLARRIISCFFSVYSFFLKKLPVSVKKTIEQRYMLNVVDKTDEEEGMYFDSVRASVNLVVSSFLVAFGTYFSIPLSTTFVVFMVVMGTSLADQAWSRDNAVYRLSGVLSILGGWFFTATMAFIGAFVTVLIIWWGEIYAVIALCAIVAVVLVKTAKYHQKRYSQQLELDKESHQHVDPNLSNLIEVGGERIKKHILETSKIYMLIIQGFVDANTKQLRETKDRTDFFNKVTQQTKQDFLSSFIELDSRSIETGNSIVQALDYSCELSSSLKLLVEPVNNHVENQHKGLSKSQQDDALLLLEEMTGFFNYMIHIEKESRFDSVSVMIDKRDYIVNLIEELRRKQIKRIMAGGKRTRVSIILLECYAESKNLVMQTINLLKSHRDFYNHSGIV